mmetsp:Transcript_50958/g.58918  ORF Transcript_50958/g.58918 Transcript_50958/m.58918 type:complete len:149 (+) Transcript_50958:57-503(+)
MIMTAKRQPSEINICICTITLLALSVYAKYRQRHRRPQPTEQQPSEKRKQRHRVTFGSIYVRHYERVAFAPPRFIGWSCCEDDKSVGISLDKYEQDRRLLKNIRQQRVGETRCKRESSVRLPLLQASTKANTHPPKKEVVHEYMYTAI